MESRLGEILDRMEARLLEIIIAAVDKQRAESISFTTESAADEHFTEFNNEVVLDCVTVTRTAAGLASFDHENSDSNHRNIPIVCAVSRCVATHLGPIDDDERFSLRQLQALPPAKGFNDLSTTCLDVSLSNRLDAITTGVTPNATTCSSMVPLQASSTSSVAKEIFHNLAHAAGASSTMNMEQSNINIDSGFAPTSRPLLPP
jgi:hypothetical protein